MEQIKDIVYGVVGELSVKKPQKETKIQRVWDALSEGKIAKHSVVYGVKDGVLMVHADSPAWIFHLNLKKKKLLKIMQEEMPELVNICFRLGKV